MPGRTARIAAGGQRCGRVGQYVAQLADRDFAFELLLPPAARPNAPRNPRHQSNNAPLRSARVASAGGDPKLSEEANEALGDIAKLAAAQPQEEGDDEDEDALAEIEEFVRVAALLLHGDCVLAARHRQRLN